jgi:hypothetical protein
MTSIRELEKCQNGCTSDMRHVLDCPVSAEAPALDVVNHPSHYTSSPAKCECGKPIECIQITEHMGFNIGNSVKYLWRCDLKNDAIEDLKKARWYIDRELAKREATK